MTERTQLILYFCIATFLVVVFIAGVLVRRYHKTERAIDAARKQMHMLGEHNELDHEIMTQEINQVSRRVQFLTARSIADELAAEKKAEAARKAKDDTA